MIHTYVATIRGFSDASRDLKDWKFLIIGPVKDEDYYKELQDLSKILGLNDNISFLGQRDSSFIRETYEECSIFVSLSRRESFGIARLEAIACGLPVLTSNAGCETCLPGALVTNIDDLQVVAKDMRNLMSDESMRNSLVSEGQEGLVEWGQIVKEYVGY